MTKQNRAKKQNSKRERIGRTPLDPTRPLGNRNPPVETQFQLGNRASVGHGRPRKAEQVREMLIDIFGEEVINPKTGKFVGTRLQIAARLAMTRSLVNMLEFVYGKLPQQIDVNDITNKSDSELLAELQSLMDTARARAGQGDRNGTLAAGTDSTPHKST